MTPVVLQIEPVSLALRTEAGPAIGLSVELATIGLTTDPVTIGLTTQQPLISMTVSDVVSSVDTPNEVQQWALNQW